MRAIDFVCLLIDSGKLNDDAYRKIHVHIIENQKALKPLGASSKLNAEWAFLTYLRDLGRETAETWLADHFDDLGQRSSVDVRAMFQGIGLEHHG
ncbi:MAG: hypothetical protein ACFB6S_06995 [Geminicoccaceae bacterium]